MEHAPNGSEWTFASLREYLLRVVADLALKQQALADAQDKAIQAALVAQEKAVQAALAAADKAVTKAEQQSESWRQSANEWRGAMGDRERTFVPRTEWEQGSKTLVERLDSMVELERSMMSRPEYAQAHQALIDRVVTLEKRDADMVAQKKGSGEAWGTIIAVVGLAAAVVGGVLGFLVGG